LTNIIFAPKEKHHRPLYSIGYIGSAETTAIQVDPGWAFDITAKLAQRSERTLVSEQQQFEGVENYITNFLPYKDSFKATKRA